jgi:hypothetical protein
MTDEQIAEIYSLGRESFFGGQRAFQFQAYPFRMTPINMARHRNNPNMPFWRMIKEGNDLFEVTKQEPKVDFCEKKYVFDAEKAPNATREPVFEASAKCPPYVMADDIAEALHQKQQADDAEMARLVAKGTPVARMNTGIDGGMNKIFAAALPDGNTGLSDGGGSQSLALVHERLPGTIPMDHVNPPHAPSDNLLAGAPQEPKIAVASAPTAGPTTRFASAGPAGQSDGFFSSLARKVGLTSAGAETTASTPPAPVASARPKAGESRRPAVARKLETKPETKPETRQAAVRPRLKPSVTDAPETAAAPAPQNSLVAGAQPIVSSNSFDSRFSAVK